MDCGESISGGKEAGCEATAESSWETWWLELDDNSWTWTKMGRFLTYFGDTADNT